MATLIDFFHKKDNAPKDGPDIRVSADVSSANFDDDDVEIINASSTPKSMKKPISSSTTKKKRTLKSVTVDKWIKNDLARDNAELWLKYTADRGGNVDALRCALCREFEDDLKYMKDFSTVWISGSRNLKCHPGCLPSRILTRIVSRMCLFACLLHQTCQTNTHALVCQNVYIRRRPTHQIYPEFDVG
jgi:hypothetical protein